MFPPPILSQGVSFGPGGGSTGTGTFTPGQIFRFGDSGTAVAYTPTADTDSARGTSLRAAVAAMQAGETLAVGPGTYAIGGNRLALPTGGCLELDPGCVITSTADLLNDGCIIYPGNNSIIRGGTVQVVTGSSSGYAAAIGVVSDAGDSARTGVQVIGTTMIGDTDAFYIEHDTACSFVLRDCVFQSKWDAVMVSASATGPHTVDIYNPRIVIVGPSSIPGIARGVTSDHQAVVRVFGGSVSAADGGTTYTAALATVNSGTLRAYGVHLAVSSSNPKYDCNNVSGTLTVAGCIGTGTGGTLLTLGTITTAGDSPGAVSKTILFTEDATSVTHTGTVTVPAGCMLLDIVVWSTVLWTDSSAAIVVGDAGSANGYFTSTNLNATDLLVGERLQAASSNFWGGKNGTYLTTAGRFGRTGTTAIGGYCPTDTPVIGVVSVTTPSGTAGRTYMQVIYAPIQTAPATTA